MSRSINLSLRGHERIFINGAVLRVDRKVTIELLNDATFLLEAHVLQAEQAITPIRQLYFIAQAMLIDPSNGDPVRVAYDKVDDAILAANPGPAVVSGLSAARNFLNAGRPFEVLRILRGIFEPIESGSQQIASEVA